MKQNKKVLVVSGFFPYPAHFGGAFDILERIVGLKQLGFEIDLLCTYKIEPDLEHIRYLKTIVHDLILVKRENRILDVFNLTPLQVMSRIVLKEVVLVKTYDFAILETEYVGKIIKNKTFKANKIFLRIQNNENVYFRELAKSIKFIIIQMQLNLNFIQNKFLKKLIEYGLFLKMN
jgi:polysaccharide biosynthesis protein PslH